MSRLPRCGLLSILAIILSTVGVLAQSTCADEPKPGKQKTAADGPQKEVVAAIADALGTLEEPDYRQFLEYYAPVHILQSARRQPGGVTATAKRIAGDETATKFFKDLATRLRKARQAKPEFNEEKTIARFEFVLEPARKLKPAELPFGSTAKKKMTVKGYGGNLAAVLDNARAALNARDYSEFLSRMLPVTDLQREDVNKLTKRLKSSPAVVERMVADLKLLQGETPKLEQKGTLAVFRIKRTQTNEAGRKKGIKLPDRVFKFQKVGGHWRLYDNTKAMVAAAAKAKVRTVPAVRGMLVMEKFRDHWRVSMAAPGFSREWYELYRRLRPRQRAKDIKK